ncbi:hypothetical protein U1Q18_050487 [Sarracenia purpurea var. burkii]
MVESRKNVVHGGEYGILVDGNMTREMNRRPEARHDVYRYYTYGRTIACLIIVFVHVAESTSEVQEQGSLVVDSSSYNLSYTRRRRAVLLSIAERTKEAKAHRSDKLVMSQTFVAFLSSYASMRLKESTIRQALSADELFADVYCGLLCHRIAGDRRDVVILGRWKKGETSGGKLVWGFVAFVERFVCLCGEGGDRGWHGVAVFSPKLDSNAGQVVNPSTSSTSPFEALLGKDSTNLTIDQQSDIVDIVKVMVLDVCAKAQSSAIRDRVEEIRTHVDTQLQNQFESTSEQRLAEVIKGTILTALKSDQPALAAAGTTPALLDGTVDLNDPWAWPKTN